MLTCIPLFMSSGPKECKESDQGNYGAAGDSEEGFGGEKLFHGGDLSLGGCCLYYNITLKFKK
jgi:hypothetical protein